MGNKKLDIFITWISSFHKFIPISVSTQTVDMFLVLFTFVRYASVLPGKFGPSFEKLEPGYRISVLGNHVILALNGPRFSCYCM